MDVKVKDEETYKAVEGKSVLASNILICIDPGHYEGKNAVDPEGVAYTEGDFTLDLHIFIIGIGTSDYSDVSYIAQQTGGAYYNAYDVYSMDSIYEEIYRMEKEMYLIEFEDRTGAEITDLSKIKTGYRSMEYGGECQYSYTPNILLSVSGASIYKDGPKEVRHILSRLEISLCS